MIKSFLKKILDRMRIVSGTINLNDRRGALHKAWGHIFSNHLLGDYVEFGVYYGDSLNKSKFFLIKGCQNKVTKLMMRAV